MKNNYVESEFAPLKRVVLAQSEFHCPNAEKQKEADTNFLVAENKELFEGKFGDFADLYPELQQRWEEEKKEMAALLESYGIEVLRPRKLTSAEKQLGIDSGHGYSNFFARDPFFTIGNLLIEGNLKFPHRQLEVLPSRPLLLAESQKEEVLYFATPQPDVSLGVNQPVGPYIEGGDVLVYGKTIFVGHSGLASNLLGIQWLGSVLSRWGYQVIPVPLHPDILHLDCALSLLREGLMICCEEAFLDGVPKELAHWQTISITLAEAALLMANGLPINEKVYVTDASFTSLIEKIEAQGMKVETLDYRISRLFGGSFRCTTQGLLRV